MTMNDNLPDEDGGGSDRERGDEEDREDGEVFHA